MIVRQATPNDANALVPLMRALGYPLNAEEIRHHIVETQKRDGVVFVTDVDNRIVGSIAANIDVRLAEGITGEIVSLVVLPEYRGLGIGKGLVEQAEAWLAPQVKVIRVRANTIRTKAHGFYKSQGFEEIKTQKVFLKKTG